MLYSQTKDFPRIVDAGDPVHAVSAHIRDTGVKVMTVVNLAGMGWDDEDIAFHLAVDQDDIDECRAYAEAAGWVEPVEVAVSPSLIVIGITGPQGSGKDTAALGLVQRGYWRIGLADPVKSGLDDLGGTSRELHKLLDAAGWTNRKAWQLLGTESRQEAMCNSVWIQVLLAKIAFLSRVLPPEQRVNRFCVPDIRRPEEANQIGQMVRMWGGRYETWKIDRPGFGPTPGSHSIEQQFDSIFVDQLLYNGGSIEQLTEAVADQAEQTERESS